MATNNKKILLIAGVSALLIGGGIFLWWKNKQAKEEEEKRKQEEEEKEAEEQKKASQGSVSPPRAIQLPPTHFINKTEGDKFRAWVNKTYPDWAKQNDLSLSGYFDNSYIRKAYKEFGSEYEKLTTKKSSAPKFSKGSVVYLKLDDSSIYSYPEFKGDYIIGNVTKKLLLDKPFAKYISNSGNGFIKVETLAFIPKCPPNARCMASLQPNKKIAYVPEKFVSNKPY